MFVPTYGLELGLDNVAFYYTLQALAMLAGNILVGKLVDRVRKPVVLLYPCLLFFCGYCAALYLAQEAVLFFSAAVLYGLGFGGACAVISVVVMSITAPEKRGAASATYLCAGDLGYCIGSFLWGQTSTVFGYRSLTKGNGAAPSRGYTVTYIKDFLMGASHQWAHSFCRPTASPGRPCVAFFFCGRGSSRLWCKAPKKGNCGEKGKA